MDAADPADAGEVDAGGAMGKRRMTAPHAAPGGEVHAATAAAEAAGVAGARSEQRSGQSRGCRERDDDFA